MRLEPWKLIRLEFYEILLVLMFKVSKFLLFSSLFFFFLQSLSLYLNLLLSIMRVVICIYVCVYILCSLLYGKLVCEKWMEIDKWKCITSTPVFLTPPLRASWTSLKALHMSLWAMLISQVLFTSRYFFISFYIFFSWKNIGQKISRHGFLLLLFVLLKQRLDVSFFFCWINAGTWGCCCCTGAFILSFIIYN